MLSPVKLRSGRKEEKKEDEEDENHAHHQRDQPAVRCLMFLFCESNVVALVDTIVQPTQPQLIALLAGVQTGRRGVQTRMKNHRRAFTVGELNVRLVGLVSVSAVGRHQVCSAKWKRQTERQPPENKALE